MNKKYYYQRGYGGIGMFLAAVVIGLVMYFYFYPAAFPYKKPIYDKNNCYLNPETSTKTMIDPKNGDEYVLIKPSAPSIRAQIDYHFSNQGDVEIDSKKYPFYLVWIDALSGDVKPPFNPNNSPGRGGGGFHPGNGADKLRFVDISADNPDVDPKYILMDIYLLKGEPVPQFIQDYCTLELPVVPLVLFQDTEGGSLPPFELNTGPASEWSGGAPLPDLQYILYAYAKEGSTSLRTATGRGAPVGRRQYTFTSAGKTTTYNAFFLINSSTETVTLMNADALAYDADIGYHYTRFELAPKIKPPVNLHQKSPGQSDMLQLEAFVPFQLPPWGWWTPECKPAIYLYPTEQMAVNVKVEINNGFLTYTDPLYPKDGWTVIANPNSNLHYLKSNLADSKGTVNYPTGIFPYLYYEGKIQDNSFTKPTTGFVKSYDQLSEFFDDILPKLGLNEKETAEFKDYWLKALPQSPYYFIGLIPQNELNTLEPLQITPKEDTLIRVRLYFEALDKYKIVKAPQIRTPQRTGFTVVDWGGMVKNDKDHPFTCLQ